MQYNLLTSEYQQELAATQIESEQDMVTDKRPPVENQIVCYNEAQDRYVLRSAGETSYVDSSELLNCYSISCQLGKRYCRRSQGFYSWIFNYISR